MTSWRNKKSEDLFNAILKLKNVDEVANFMRDLLTEQEIESFSSRWEVAKELDKGKSQRKVSEETGVALSTVTRVNLYLKRGMGGYRLLLNRLNSPAYADTSVDKHHHSH